MLSPLRCDNMAISHCLGISIVSFTPKYKTRIDYYKKRRVRTLTGEKKELRCQEGDDADS